MSRPEASKRVENATVPMDLDVEFEEEENTQRTPSPSRSRTTSHPGNALSKLIDSESDNDKPDHNPRKTILGRIQPKVSGDSSDSEESDADAAYQRVRERLMSKPDQIEAQKSATRPASPVVTRPATIPLSSEDDEDMPVRLNAARRRKASPTSASSARSSRSPTVRSRHSSPGLFVSPNASPVANRVPPKSPMMGSASESDRPKKARNNRDLAERVKRIRAERLAREGEDIKNSKSKKTQGKKVVEDSDSDADGEIGRRLTQQSRPTRKAGKKALEEMSREQQRLSRNMQLAHTAKTKKKYTTKDLFARLNYQTEADQTLPSPDVTSLPASSDVEAIEPHDTPPTSPPSQEDDLGKTKVFSGLETPIATGTEPVNIEPTPENSRLDKGKGRAPEFEHLPPNSHSTIVQRMQLTPTERKEIEMVELSGSEDELSAAKPKSRFPVFDRLPQQKQSESNSLLHLRHLAHVGSEGRRPQKGKKTMNMVDLQASLFAKAREQVNKERHERIEDLKRRGIHVETEEEREKNQREIDDLVAQLEKAREEDMKLTKQEKDEARKNGDAPDGLLSSDESEDEDYIGSEVEGAEKGEDEADEEAFDLSGSDEDEADIEDELDEDEDSVEKGNLLDDAAEEDDEELGDASSDKPTQDDEDMEDPEPFRRPTARRGRNVVIVDDDESETDAPVQSTPLRQAVHPSPTQVDDGMAAAFGFDKSSPGLGLTQMFAGTMADIQSISQYDHPLDNEPEQDSLDFLRGLPTSQAEFTQASDMLVPNSQTLNSPIKSQHAPLPELHLGISQLIETSPAFSHTQDFEPTQDAGFGLSRSPAGFVPVPSTVDTVMLPVAESPVTKRKGRLQQRKHMVVSEFSDVEEENDNVDGLEQLAVEAPTKGDDAFAVLNKAARKEKRKVDNFNKKTSWARDAIEEQAEESEDEYAGIGGASDDDSAEEDEEVAKMIDHSDVKVDERKLAAYYLQKEKANDEKNINQLFKDVMTGGLRKRRGGDAFEVSDSEDESEQRRRKKQMQFRQMTKALISDERIGQIAQNPKKSAFFNTLADHLEDPDNDFLNEPEMATEMDPSQSQSDEGKDMVDSTNITIPNSQVEDTAITAPLNPLKRKSPDSQEKENRPPAHMRRTNASDTLARKPMTIADIQHSVSELLDDPRIMIPDSQAYDSDSDLEIESAQPASRKPVIDRLTLSRTSTLESEVGNTGHLAFVAPAVGAPGFRVPSLVRRATSNLSTVSNGGSGASTPVEGSGVRRGGTGRSNIHAQAREAERRAALEKVEKKRKDELKKKVTRAKNQRSVLANLGGGFE